MAGAVIENVSSKKLWTGGFIIFILAILGFLLGGMYISAKPNHADENIATECWDSDGNFEKDIGLMPWHPIKAAKLPTQQCNLLTDEVRKSVQNEEVVLSLHIPVNGVTLTRWFSYLLVLVYPELTSAVKPNSTRIHFDAKFYHRNDPNEKWTLGHKKNFSRRYNCEETQFNKFVDYSCEPMNFIELGSVPHRYYLVNFKLRKFDEDGIRINDKIGEFSHVNMPVIYQPPEFTKLWLSLQTCVFVSQWFFLVWFTNRIAQLNRPKTLIEKSILGLGIAIQVGNFPVQWLALFMEAPWMLLMSDIRQGLAYMSLFGFWLVFMSEHLLDRAHRDNLKNYAIHLIFVIVCGLSMFILDCIERGWQLKDPFWSVWDTDHGRNAAVAMPIVGGVFGGLYLINLGYIIFKVSYNLFKRQQHFIGRLHAEGLIIRFQIIIGFTLLCAIASLVAFYYNEATDSPVVINEHHIQVQSAIYTGLYVLWNLYVLSVMLLYAPSHKRYSSDMSETIPLNSEVTSISGSRVDSLQSVSHAHNEQHLLASLTADKFNTD